MAAACRPPTTPGVDGDTSSCPCSKRATRRARREIAAERDRAVAELRREAVDLSLAAASKLIQKRLDSETDRKLVLEYLATLDGGR